MPNLRYRSLMVLVFAIMSLCAVLPTAAQDTPPAPPVYRIAEVDYRISGLTLKSFLGEYLDIKIGRPFPDQTSLEDYIASLNRKILNNRVFTEKSSVGFEILGEEEPHPVRIIVTTFNSWSALAVPFAQIFLIRRHIARSPLQGFQLPWHAGAPEHQPGLLCADG